MTRNNGVEHLMETAHQMSVENARREAEVNNQDFFYKSGRVASLFVMMLIIAFLCQFPMGLVIKYWWLGWVLGG